MTGMPAGHDHRQPSPLLGPGSARVRMDAAPAQRHSPELHAGRHRAAPGARGRIPHRARAGAPVDRRGALDAGHRRERTDFVAGVVAWADLAGPDLGRDLDSLCARPGLVGIRHPVEVETDETWLCQACGDRRAEGGRPTRPRLRPARRRGRTSSTCLSSPRRCPTSAWSWTT